MILSFVFPFLTIRITLCVFAPAHFEVASAQRVRMVEEGVEGQREGGKGKEGEERGKREGGLTKRCPKSARDAN